MSFRPWCVVMCALVVALAWAPSATAARPGLSLGFVDSNLSSQNDHDYALGLTRARDAGATIWRSFVRWSAIAPARPPDATAAADPAWPGYDWRSVDRDVRAVTTAGMESVLVIMWAPAWAEGAHRPPEQKAPAGTWRPSPEAARLFATALAKRYSGAFRDANGVILPRVRFVQAWNEPNLAQDITPQWIRSKKRWVRASPGIYRKLLNAIYRGVKNAVPSTTVITAGTAPYGDFKRSTYARIPPVAFWRALLCVTGRTMPRSTSCGHKVWFDALAHHPYPIGPPRRRARNPDDAVVPDFGKITRVLRVAQRAGTVKPRGSKPLWATEISWDSWPDPNGLSLDQQAQYLEGALNVLWNDGVRYVTWFNLRDEHKGQGWNRTYQSGVYERGASVGTDIPKPSLDAYRFPFTAYRERGVAKIWGKAPRPGSVRIEVRLDGRWVTATSLTAAPNRIFIGILRVGRGTELRAVSAGDKSLSWRAF